MSEETPLEALAARVAGKPPVARLGALRGVSGALKPRSEPVKPVTQPAAGGVRG